VINRLLWTSHFSVTCCRHHHHHHVLSLFGSVIECLNNKHCIVGFDQHFYTFAELHLYTPLCLKCRWTSLWNRKRLNGNFCPVECNIICLMVLQCSLEQT